jgi:rare lipoprotein A
VDDPRVHTKASMVTSYKRASSTFVIAIFFLIFSAACGGKKVKTAKPPRIGSSQTGIASWYGHPYHGRRAANGEIYDMEKLTAAHRTYPFDTWVRVKNLSNDRTVDVRVQDRGPFIRGRIIDLSHAAAREIDLVGPGITKVRLTVIKPPKNPKRQPELYSLQVGAFQDRKRATALQNEMQRRYGSAKLIERGANPALYRVVAGEFATMEQAEAAAGDARRSGGQAFVVRLDDLR